MPTITEVLFDPRRSLRRGAIRWLVVDSTPWSRTSFVGLPTELTRLMATVGVGVPAVLRLIGHGSSSSDAV
jgi:hypothetical protein